VYEILSKLMDECWRYRKLKQCHFWARLKGPIFGLHDSQGSAETLVRRGGITNYHLISYSFSNISAKNYQNWFTCIEVIVCNVSVVFWDTVYWGTPTGAEWKPKFINSCRSSHQSNVNRDSIRNKIHMNSTGRRQTCEWMACVAWLCDDDNVTELVWQSAVTDGSNLSAPVPETTCVRPSITCIDTVTATVIIILHWSTGVTEPT